MTSPGARALLDQWHRDLAAWVIPHEITSRVSESPWALPRQVLARRARRQVRQPFGCSFELERKALDPPGELLDVGAGAGTACLPLARMATGITAVDVDQELLNMLTVEAGRLGAAVRTVTGRWPDVADEVGPADVVTCHHVFYNVADLEPFVAALTRRARRQVVVELTARHPLAALNPLWERFHGLRRPEGPTAADAAAILTALGLDITAAAWTRPNAADHATFAELVEVTRRRLCLPAARAGELAAALRESGADGGQLSDLGTSGRQLVTLCWPGAAGRSASASAPHKAPVRREPDQYPPRAPRAGA